MNNTLKMTLAAAVALGATSFSTAAMAGASANIGVTSNYIWRGMTQTDDAAAIQGGLDYEADNGFYVGTWTSNINFPDNTGDKRGAEVDLYGGYANTTAGGVDYDIGAIAYLYPATNNDGSNFTEVYGSIGYKGFGAEVAYTVDKETSSANDDDVYYALGYEGETANGLGFALKAGKYDFDGGSANDYNHYHVSVSKSDFTFAVDDTDASGSAGDTRVSVAWSKSFDL